LAGNNSIITPTAQT